MNAKDFMKEAHLHILFSKSISNIQFCRTKDSQNIEKVNISFFFGLPIRELIQLALFSFISNYYVFNLFIDDFE